MWGLIMVEMLLGRQAELARLDSFLDRRRPVRAARRAVRQRDRNGRAPRRGTAAVELEAVGLDVRYISSTFIPDEESCFCAFEASAADDVRRACDHAGVAFARIVETHDFFP